MITPLDQFIRESIHRARTELSYQDALDYLRGVVRVFDDRVEEIARFRETVLNLAHCDRQLDLIATGQLRLEFDDAVCFPVLRTSAERILWARKHRKLTLSKLAARSGTSMSRISEYANGRPLPPVDAERIARGLDISAAWLLTGAEQSPLQNAA